MRTGPSLVGAQLQIFQAGLLPHRALLSITEDGGETFPTAVLKTNLEVGEWQRRGGPFTDITRSTPRPHQGRW